MGRPSMMSLDAKAQAVRYLKRFGGAMTIVEAAKIVGVSTNTINVWASTSKVVYRVRRLPKPGLGILRGESPARAAARAQTRTIRKLAKKPAKKKAARGA